MVEEVPGITKQLEALKDPEVREILKKAIIVQQNHMAKYGYKTVTDYLGFQWFEVQAAPQTLNKLVRLGILEVGYKSNKAKHYRIPDIEKLKQLLQMTEIQETTIDTPQTTIPNDLFNIIIGHDDVKEILWKSINSNCTVHVLLHGSPASAKSLFLEELARLPNSRFVLGSSLSKAGLLQVLFEQKPRYLIIDEIDKISDEDNLSALLSLMERGTVTETKYRRQRSINLLTNVYAAGNRIDTLPRELLSRFITLRFKDYTPDEFMEVAVKVLTDREKTPPPIAIHIAESVLRKLLSRDPRDAVKVARLLTQPSKEEVDRIMEILVNRR